jgi:hypothetical protein
VKGEGGGREDRKKEKRGDGRMCVIRESGMIR